MCREFDVGIGAAFAVTGVEVGITGRTAANDGYFLETAELRGQNTTVSAKRRRGFVNEHRHEEAKFTYAVGDLADLFLRMRTRVTGG